MRVVVVTAEDRVGTRIAGQGRQRPGLAIEVVSGVVPAEAFVLVTPQNEVPAALRRAIEAGCAQWRAKPVAFVSYETDPSAAADASSAAITELRNVFASLHVVVVGSFGVDGATAMFEQLEWWGRALRDRRNGRNP